MGVLTDLAQTIRPLRRIIWPQSTDTWMRFLGLPNERDYGALVGDGSNSNLVEAVVRWLNRYYIQAPIVIRKYESDSDEIGTMVRRHPLLTLLRWPTIDEDANLPRGYYNGTALGKALVASYVIDGNAYLLKKRATLSEEVVQLWFVPPGWIEPMWRGNDFISAYRFRPEGSSVDQFIRVEDIVHIRDGVDPRNPRKGCSPIKKVLREVYVDEKTARFTAALITNFGVPGIVISPEGPGTISAEQATTAKTAFMDKFGGDHTGEPLVMRGATKITPFGWSPQELDLSAIRDVPEERISSVTGIPAAVLGFGSGMHQVKVGATMDALVDQGILNAFIPLTKTFDEEFTGQLLPDFVSSRAELDRTEVAHDLSSLPVMAKWWLDQSTLWTALTKGTIATRGEARRRFGLRARPDDDLFIAQAGVTVSEDGQAPLALPAGKKQEDDAADEEDDDTEEEDAAAKAPSLTPRQSEIAAFVGRGLTNKEIAEKFNTSVRTIEREVTTVLRNANVSDRRALVV